ncbi:MAG: hypothetical protein F6K24_26340 [Okeania sp. SIO2D1]|nr:hypothetical protein [Okeania sp. SIO2D1]
MLSFDIGLRINNNQKELSSLKNALSFNLQIVVKTFSPGFCRFIRTQYQVIELHTTWEATLLREQLDGISLERHSYLSCYATLNLIIFFVSVQIKVDIPG